MQTPFGLRKLIDGANAFTSSAVRDLVRSVTAQTRVLRVLTNTTPASLPTDIMRASGTTA